MSTAQTVSVLPDPALASSGAAPGLGVISGLQETEPIVPAAGLVLPLVLIAVGLMLWRWARLRGSIHSGNHADLFSAWRRAWTGRQGAPSLLHATALGAGHRLYVVTWREQEFLIGVGPGAAPALIATHVSSQPRESAID